MADADGLGGGDGTGTITIDGVASPAEGFAEQSTYKTTETCS